ncbi:MAG TPA: extracellular solute-binding protein, partial [Myxococcota bacterium]|nr:extracellular solute-binding protein [Myxococcota bacterium]
MWRWVWIAAAVAVSPPVAAAEGEVVLWHAYRAGEAEALDVVVESFRARHPEVRLRVLQVPYGAYPQKLRTAIPQGAGPDLFIAPNDHLRDFIERELITPARGVPRERFDARLVAALTLKDQVWGYPLAYKTLVLFYRRDMVEAPPRDTDDLLAMARRLTGDGRYGFVYQASLPYYHAPWLFGFGGKLFDGDRLLPFESPAAIASGEFLRRLTFEEKVTPVDISGALATELFNRGRAAMVMNGPWFVSEIAADVPWAVAPLPVVSATGLPARPFASLDVLYRTTRADSSPGAAALIEALTSDAAALVRARVGRQPVANAAVAHDPVVEGDQLLAMQARQLEATEPLPIEPVMQLAWDPYESALRQIQRGSKSPESAFREATKRVQVLARPLPEAAPMRLYVLAALVLVAVGLSVAVRRAGREVWSDVRRSGSAYAFIAPAAIGMALLVGVPFVMGVGLGFFEYEGTQIRFVGLGNFASILGTNDYSPLEPMSFYFTMAVTVLWTVSNIALHVAIGFGFALLLQPTWLRGRGVFRVLLILPWAIPNYITALIFKGLFNTQLGAINALLVKIGLPAINWFDHFASAFAANLTTNVWLGFPFMMVTILGALQAIPSDLYEAARVDGAGPWRRFSSITLPLVGPALVPSVVLGTIWTFNMFNVVFCVSEGQPEGATDILVTEAYRWAFMRNGRYGYAAAYSLVIFAI